jgi:uncharacterized protein with ATP-grasp and redox domains
MPFLSGKHMRVHQECLPCFRRQCLIALDLGGINGGEGARMVEEALGEIREADLAKSPAHATTRMHRALRRLMGRDPFREVKGRYNEKALALYGGLRERVAGSGDPLQTAARLAIAGNVIDFGIYTSIDVEGTVGRALGEPLAVDHTGAFRRAVERAGDVLYLLDNAGEAAFDRLLIEELRALGKEVTAVAKASPVINDCTAEDARQVGLEGVCRVVDNGSDSVGTILETTSPAFRELFARAGLVISKGQGNFETLLEEEREVFFLFQSKCAVVSRVLGLPQGLMLLAGNRS